VNRSRVDPDNATSVPLRRHRRPRIPGRPTALGSVPGVGRAAANLIRIFAGWTLFIWGNRISNLLQESGRTTADKAPDLAVATGAVLLALVALAAVSHARRGGSLAGWASTVIQVLAGVSIALWLLRTPGMLVDPAHSTAFKVVHASLAAVSISLAALSLVAVRRSGRPAVLEGVAPGRRASTAS
jgi:hypothetical protein